MQRLQTHAESRDHTIDRVKIGYIGGGSQQWAHTLINDLAQCADMAGEVALYDIDYESAAKNAKFGNQITDRNAAVSDWTFNAFESLERALEGANFVICSTQDPPEETFVHDIDIPQKYGIYQTVADTVGPGGTLRAMRAIPQYRKIAAVVREQCPNAWVINYTNPMTICTRTLYEEYPDINAIGLCHEVFKSQELFSNIAEKYIDEAEDVVRDEINVNVKGINHFTWIDEAYWRDEDVFRYLDQELEERKPFPKHKPGDMEGESYYINNQNVAFDLYDIFGIIGAAGDRHLVEFVPWYLDINDLTEIHRWGIRLTPSSARIRDSDDLTQTEKYLSGNEKFEFYESGEEVVNTIRALLGIAPIKTNINYPNIGQTPDLAEGAIVETNALITGDDVSPICAGKLPLKVRDIIHTHISNQETLIKAGFTGDLDLAFQAFINEPLVTLQTDKAKELFTELVELEQDYLQDWNLDSANVLNNA